MALPLLVISPILNLLPRHLPLGHLRHPRSGPKGRRRGASTQGLPPPNALPRLLRAGLRWLCPPGRYPCHGRREGHPLKQEFPLRLPSRQCHKVRARACLSGRGVLRRHSGCGSQRRGRCRGWAKLGPPAWPEGFPGAQCQCHHRVTRLGFPYCRSQENVHRQRFHGGRDGGPV